MSHRISTSIFVLVLCLTFVNLASAQLNTADILGTVTDQAGAVVPNVKITVTNTATNDTKTVTTTGSGDFVVNLLPSGQYTVTAEAPSFKKATANTSVVSGDRQRVDIKLQVGNVTEVVEVAATAPALQTDSATLSTVISSTPINSSSVGSVVGNCGQATISALTMGMKGALPRVSVPCT